MALLIAAIATVVAVQVYMSFGFYGENMTVLLLVPIIVLFVAQLFLAKASRIGKLTRAAGEKGKDARTAMLISVMMGLVLYLTPTCITEMDMYIREDFLAMYALVKIAGAFVIAENIVACVQLVVKEITGNQAKAPEWKPPVVPSSTPQGK